MTTASLPLVTDTGTLHRRHIRDGAAPAGYKGRHRIGTRAEIRAEWSAIRAHVASLIGKAER